MATYAGTLSFPSSQIRKGGMVRFLGWFSIGLGLTEIISPGLIAKITGTPKRARNPQLVRIYGIREVVTGAGILTQPNPARWLWSRVAGDAMDLATLGTVMACRRAKRARTAAAIASVAGVTVCDIQCARQLHSAIGR